MRSSMKSTLAVLTMGVTALTLSTQSFATTSTGSEAVKGLKAAYEATQQIQSQLQDGTLNPIVKAVLDILVAQGIENLRLKGETQLADQLEQEWQNQISTYLDESFHSLDLGDHDPLSPWLANFYNVLMQKTDGLAGALEIISDINTLNYALGVVLHPNGSWRAHTAYDRIEYRKHFIPFANLSTYWISLEACKYYVKNYNFICGYGADELEKLMGRYVAPQISDEVFALATGQGAASSSPVSAPVSESTFESNVMQQAQAQE